MTATTDHATSVRDKLYIGGEWVSPAGAGKIEVVNPTTEEPLGSVPEGSAQDVERAVEAAREAFASWSQTPVRGAPSPFKRSPTASASGWTRSPR